MRMATNQIAAKVWAASLAALLAPILLAGLARLFPDVPLPVDANDLAQTIILGIVTGAITLTSGYLKAPNPADQIKIDPPLDPPGSGIY